MPFKVILLLMLIELIYSSTLWIKYIPPKEGLSDPHSPCNILTSVKFDFNKDCLLPFRSYAQAHDEHIYINTKDARTFGSISWNHWEPTRLL